MKLKIIAGSDLPTFNPWLSSITHHNRVSTISRIVNVNGGETQDTDYLQLTDPIKWNQQRYYPNVRCGYFSKWSESVLVSLALSHFSFVLISLGRLYNFPGQIITRVECILSVYSCTCCHLLRISHYLPIMRWCCLQHFVAIWFASYWLLLLFLWRVANFSIKSQTVFNIRVYLW